MLAPLPAKSLRFDAFTLDLSRCVVRRGDQELPLRRQSFDVLRHLAERAGEIVSRRELLDAVWPGLKVTEDSVVQCIKEIRHAFGEDARWIIRTVSRRGYVFMAEVVAQEAPTAPLDAPRAQSASDVPQGCDAAPGPATPRAVRLAALPPRAQAALVAAGLLILAVAGGWLGWRLAYPKPAAVLTMSAEPSIAVLRFKTLDDDGLQSSVGSSLTDDIVTAFGRTPPGPMMVLKSAAAYGSGDGDPRAIGRALHARYLLLGGVRREGDVLNISVRLIEAESGHQLWTERIREAPGARIYTATSIARMVGLAVLAIEGMRPLPAVPTARHYAFLSLSRVLNRERDAATNREALALSQKALELDANSVPALVGYARAILNIAQHGRVPGERRSALLDEAEQALQRAIARAPLDVAAALDERGRLLHARGDYDGAIAAYEHALAVNPTFAPLHGHLGIAKIAAGRAGEAIAHIEEAIKLSPTDPLNYLWYFAAGRAAIHIGDFDGAVRWLQKSRHANRAYGPPVSWLAIAYVGLGREDEGRALLQQHLKGKNANMTIAEWTKRVLRNLPAEQRMRIEGLLRRLGVPDGEVQVGAGDRRRSQHPAP